MATKKKVAKKPATVKQTTKSEPFHPFAKGQELSFAEVMEFRRLQRKAIKGGG